jgi:hypothetical protein
MRRWFEFGSTAPVGYPSDFQPLIYTSERNGGDGDAFFISMPHKQKLWTILNQVQPPSLAAGWVFIQCQPLDQGVDPLAGCPAQHIPRPYSLQLVWSNPITSWLLFGFPKVGGGFTEGLFSFAYEPPDKDGA